MLANRVNLVCNRGAWLPPWARNAQRHCQRKGRAAAPHAVHSPSLAPPAPPQAQAEQLAADFEETALELERAQQEAMNLKALGSALELLAGLRQEQEWVLEQASLDTRGVSQACGRHTWPCSLLLLPQRPAAAAAAPCPRGVLACMSVFDRADCCPPCQAASGDGSDLDSGEPSSSSGPPIASLQQRPVLQALLPSLLLSPEPPAATGGPSAWQASDEEGTAASHGGGSEDASSAATSAPAAGAAAADGAAGAADGAGPAGVRMHQGGTASHGAQDTISAAAEQLQEHMGVQLQEGAGGTGTGRQFDSARTLQSLQRALRCAAAAACRLCSCTQESLGFWCYPRFWTRPRRVPWPAAALLLARPPPALKQPHPPPSPLALACSEPRLGGQGAAQQRRGPAGLVPPLLPADRVGGGVGWGRRPALAHRRACGARSQQQQQAAAGPLQGGAWVASWLCSSVVAAASGWLYLPHASRAPACPRPSECWCRDLLQEYDLTGSESVFQEMKRVEEAWVSAGGFGETKG